jgi:hypothetical protein
MSITSCRLAFVVLLIGIFAACTNPTMVPTPISPSGSAKKARIETNTPLPQPTQKISTPTHTAIPVSKAAAANTPTRKRETPVQTTASKNQATPTDPSATSDSWGILVKASNLQGAPFAAVYQEFEHGYMIWRGDFNCVYAINEDYVMAPPLGTNNGGRVYCLTIPDLVDPPSLGTAPEGKILPEALLAWVWSYYPEIQQALGFATQPAVHYTASPSKIDPWEGSGDGPFLLQYMSLPDGKIFTCAARGGRLGKCWRI